MVGTNFSLLRLMLASLDKQPLVSRCWLSISNNEYLKKKTLASAGDRLVPPASPWALVSYLIGHFSRRVVSGDSRLSCTPQIMTSPPRTGRRRRSSCSRSTSWWRPEIFWWMMWSSNGSGAPLRMGLPPSRSWATICCGWIIKSGSWGWGRNPAVHIKVGMEMQHMRSILSPCLRNSMIHLSSSF